MWIMVSGPYTSGARTGPDRAANLRAMNLAAVELLRRGHTPVIGVNMALPMIDAAESVASAKRDAEPSSFDEIMMPVSLALADRCDAVLRIGGPSAGADAEVERFRASGKAVFRSLEEIP